MLETEFGVEGVYFALAADRGDLIAAQDIVCRGSGIRVTP